mmetsp:Transcript_24041/g.58638  ORF Transcript_24041/g.58638 Transcript_24041/m.58638 type:complete len:87 (-) Transcript_24041:116-376(-)
MRGESAPREGGVEGGGGQGAEGGGAGEYCGDVEAVQARDGEYGGVGGVVGGWTVCGRGGAVGDMGVGEWGASDLQLTFLSDNFRVR